MLKLWKLRCSFCKKTAADVSQLVAGPGVFICDECVAVANRLMDAPPDQRPAPGRRSPWRSILRGIRHALGIDDLRDMRRIAAG
jgi:hypothetical protein